VQDSPIVVRIVPRPGAQRLVCAVDRKRPKTCARRTRLKLASGRHTVAVWAIGRRGRKSAKRSVSVVVPQRAPQAVSVGGQPVGIAAVGSTLWVSDGSGGNVVQVDAATRKVTARVPVGGQLGGIAASASAVWVSRFDSGQLVRIDPSSRTVVARVQIGGQPTSIAFDAAGAVWVGNLDGSVRRIDPATNHVTAVVALPSGASTLLTRGDLIWIGLQNGLLVSLAPASAALTGQGVQVAPDVDAITDTPAGFWVATFDGVAARIDPASRAVQRRVRLPSRGGGIAYANGAVWVSLYDLRLALELDPQTGAFLGAVHTGGQPRESLVAAGSLWIVDQAAGALTPLPLG
jgi:streptogramin lyase